MKFDEFNFFKFSEKIDCLPIIYGDGIFAEILNNILINNNYEAIALPLPAPFAAPLSIAVDLLPKITIVGYIEESTERFGYAPISNCSALACAIRFCKQERINFFCIDYDIQPFSPENQTLPDSFALRSLSVSKYCAAISLFSKKIESQSQLDLRIRYQAYQLRQLEKNYKKILYLPALQYWQFVKSAYLEKRVPPPKSDFSCAPEIFDCSQETLAFILSELPFTEELFFKNKNTLISDNFAINDYLKELLITARSEYYKKHTQIYEKISTQKFQALLIYMRNLALIRRQLTPDLYTIIVAAKQVINDEFAIILAETAKKYSYNNSKTEEYSNDILENNYSKDFLIFQPNKAFFSYENKIHTIFNRLDGRLFSWKNVKLKHRELPKDKYKNLKQHWNLHTICSWPPEDVRIENFNSYMREYSKNLISDNFGKTEKFTASLKDGLDIRETLKKWYTGDIYIKENPPTRGSIDTVLIFFEYPIDYEKYTWRTTLFAEHQKESTIAFIATDYREKIIGPLIGKAQYAALVLWYPPRLIKNIWQDKRFDIFKTPEQRIAAAAMFHSREKHCALLSVRPPDLALQNIAKLFKKKWIYISINKFSQQMIQKLRDVHILGGHKVRSYAADFLGK